MKRRVPTNKKRLIGWFSSYEKRITQTAELAQISHDTDTLVHIASLGLGPLSLFAETVSLRQQGNSAAERKACELIEQGPSGFKARAMVLLASNRWETNPDEALAMYERAKSLADDPSTALTITKMQAVVWSSLGDHTRALHMLEDGVSLLRQIQYNPPLSADFLNSLAVENIHVGRFDQARQLCRITTSSPWAALFPQWTETASGLWADKRGRKMSISVPSQKADVLPFTTLREPPGIATRLLRARAVAVVSAISDPRLLACLVNLNSLRGPNLELFIRAQEIDPTLAQVFLQQIDKHDSLLAERTGVSEN